MAPRELLVWFEGRNTTFFLANQGVFLARTQDMQGEDGSCLCGSLCSKSSLKLPLLFFQDPPIETLGA